MAVYEPLLKGGNSGYWTALSKPSHDKTRRTPSKERQHALREWYLPETLNVAKFLASFFQEHYRLWEAKSPWNSPASWTMFIRDGRCTTSITFLPSSLEVQCRCIGHFRQAVILSRLQPGRR